VVAVPLPGGAQGVKEKCEFLWGPGRGGAGRGGAGRDGAATRWSLFGLT
jgi:hypothetical protein